MELDPEALALFTEGYEKILAGIGKLGFDVHDENFADTAKRAAKGFSSSSNRPNEKNPNFFRGPSTMLTQRCGEPSV